jgi:hypothetical protein
LFVHALPHWSGFGGWQLSVHCPPEQSWPAGHALPQLPQCCVLVLVFTHWPEQSVKPGLQVKPQLPELQVAVAFGGA